MEYVEAPTEHLPNGIPSLFLAGGISGCRDWQRELVDLLHDAPLMVLNPRRESFAIDAPDAARAQIEWEYRHLRRATARLFWFTPPTHCPIALFELGAWSRGREPLFVGVDPAYSRRLDVIEQLRLARPHVNVADSIEALVQQVIAWRPSGATA
jgi:hypothetical protein